MRHSLTFLALLLLATGIAPTSLRAQVRGISYTVAPAAEYTWYDSRSGLNEAFQVGGMLGIGFGEFVELRALYAQTVDQKVDLEAFNVDESLLANRDVELIRYGGELKLNLSRGKFLPFLTVGAGVQDLGRTDLESAQSIYASAGLGLTLSAADRFTFNLEGKNLAYSYDAVRNLLNDAERTAQNLDNTDFALERFGNWSVGANLEFYLGGRRPGELSAIDQAYLDAFANGSGLRIPLEVNLARIDFDDALPYRNAWLGGSNLGIDIGPYIGLRAFYLRAMQEDQVQLDFDPLALYGGDVRLNLNRASQGVRPFLTIGGGYLNVNEDYAGREGQTATSQGFATGGVGLVLGLGNTVRLNGSVKSLLISDVGIEDLNTTSQIRSSWMYSAGLQFSFGRRPADPEALVETRSADELSARRESLRNRIFAQQQANQRERERLRQRYELRITDLESRLNRAYAADTFDPELTVALLREIEQADSVLAELDRRERSLAQRELQQELRMQDSIDILFPDPYARPQPPLPRAEPPAASYEKGLVVLSPAQLNALLDRLLLVREQQSPRPDPYLERQIQSLAERIDSLERRPRPATAPPAPSTESVAPPSPLDTILQRLDQLERRLNAAPAAAPQAAVAPDSNRREQERLERVEERLRAMEQEAAREPDSTEIRLRESLRILEQRLREAEQTGTVPPGDTLGLRQSIRSLEEQLAPRPPSAGPDSATVAELRQLREEIRTLRDRRPPTPAAVPTATRRTAPDSTLLVAQRQANRELRATLSELTKEIRDLRAEQARYQDQLAEFAAARPARDAEVSAAAIAAIPADDTIAAAADSTTTGIGSPDNPPRTVQALEDIEIERRGPYLADTTATPANIAYTGLSAFAGFNLGQNDNNTLNVGLRWHYNLVPRGYFQFVPETFFGIGDPTNFGLFANIVGVVQRDVLDVLRPYGGIGFGFMQMADSDSAAPDDAEFRPAFNLIFGTYINVLGGRLYADFTARNLFANNQFVTGYRFAF
jgi:hypothetical protein